jgi:tetratricopeptide (TPR) repeat protein
MSSAPFSQLVISAELAMKGDDFISAVRDFSAALELKSDDAYLIQQYAVATYKSKSPTALAALNKAREIIHQLHPETSHNCETLGIAGAIHKKLWIINRNLGDLTQAIDYYGRGFNYYKNYHCGENYALCLNFQASIQKDKQLQHTLNAQAKKVREELITLLDTITVAQDFADRADKKWVLATLANTLFALGRTDEGHFYEGFLFLEKEEVFSQWERDSYEHEKLALMKMLNSNSASAYRNLQ